MGMPEGFRSASEERPAAADREATDDALAEFNRPFLRDPAFGRLGVFVRDGAGAIVARLEPSHYAGWLFVNNLSVEYPPDHRRFFLQKRLV